MSNRKYKGILLDLDNTLYDYPPMHKAALDTVLAEISRVIDVSTATLEGMYCRAQAVGKQRLEGKAASHSRILYIQWMLESLGIFSYRFALDLENLYWNTFFGHNDSTSRNGGVFAAGDASYMHRHRPDRHYSDAEDHQAWYRAASPFYGILRGERS